MRILLSIFFFFLISSTFLHSQIKWAPIGAEWNYKIVSGNYYPNFEAWLNIEAIDTATALGVECTKMLNTKKDFDGQIAEETWYTYLNNDTVYYYRPNWFDEFVILYDFSAGINDTVSFSSGSTSYSYNTEHAIIDSITLIQYSTWSLNEWHLNEYIGNLTYQTYIERVGSRIGMFPQGTVFTGNAQFQYLRCYQDDEINYKLVDDCEYWGMLSNLEGIVNLEIIVYPNPVSDNLNLEIRNWDQEITYEFVSMLGETLLHGKLYSGDNNISIGNLNEGMFWLKLYSGNSIIKVNPIIVTK